MVCYNRLVEEFTETTFKVDIESLSAVSRDC